MPDEPTATAAYEVLTDVPDDAPPYSDSYEWQPATAASDERCICGWQLATCPTCGQLLCGRCDPDFGDCDDA